MDNILFKTDQQHQIRPVDVFVVGVLAVVVGGAGIFASMFLPLAPELNFGIKFGGYFFLAAGTTAAALSILRQEALDRF
jgi:hypothetical protein